MTFLSENGAACGSMMRAGMQRAIATGKKLDRESYFVCDEQAAASGIAVPDRAEERLSLWEG